MLSVTAEQQFPMPIAAAFERVCDVARYPQRIDSYVEVRFEGEQREGVGARFRQTRTVFGREHAQLMEVSVWEPPRELTLQAREGGARYESRYHFRERGEGTLVSLTFSATPDNPIARLFMKLLGGKMIASTGRAMAEDLRQLASAS